MDNHRNLNRPLVIGGLNVLHLWGPNPPPTGDRARGADHQAGQKGVIDNIKQNAKTSPLIGGVFKFHFCDGRPKSETSPEIESREITLNFDQDDCDQTQDETDLIR